MGPGEAKGEFRTHLAGSGPASMPAITVETADKMTDAQVMAKVKQHFSV
jgi:hypothetical protein